MKISTSLSGSMPGSSALTISWLSSTCSSMRIGSTPSTADSISPRNPGQCAQPGNHPSRSGHSGRSGRDRSISCPAIWHLRETHPGGLAPVSSAAGLANGAVHRVSGTTDGGGRTSMIAASQPAGWRPRTTTARAGAGLPQARDVGEQNRAVRAVIDARPGDRNVGEDLVEVLSRAHRDQQPGLGGHGGQQVQQQADGDRSTVVPVVGTPPERGQVPGRMDPVGEEEPSELKRLTSYDNVYSASSDS